MKKTATILAIVLIGILALSGCSHVTTKQMMNFTYESEKKVHEFLVSWPDYSGIIDGLPDWVKDRFFTGEAERAKKILDELSTYCASLKEALGESPPDPLCDFKDWNLEVIIPPEVNWEAKMIANRVIYTGSLGPLLVWTKKDQKNQYVTGYAVGITATMASEIILKQLKEISKFFPEVDDVIKYLGLLF